MKDRRPIDDLSIDEIERVLADKKRAAREARLAGYRSTGRAVHVPVGETPAPPTSKPAYAPRSFIRKFFDFFEAKNGRSRITVTVNDGQATSNLFTRTFEIQIMQAPTLTELPDQVTFEGSEAKRRGFRILLCRRRRQKANPVHAAGPRVRYLDRGRLGRWSWVPGSSLCAWPSDNPARRR